jgi:hypothetical protein
LLAGAVFAPVDGPEGNAALNSGLAISDHLKAVLVAAVVESAGRDAVEFTTTADGRVLNIPEPQKFMMMTPADEANLLAQENSKTILPLLLDGSRFLELIDVQDDAVTGGRLPSARFINSLCALVR